MKELKTTTIGGFEVARCTFIFEGDKLNGLFIHEIKDDFGDGDCVVEWDFNMPETHEEIVDILQNEFNNTDYEILDTIQPISPIAYRRMELGMTQRQLSEATGFALSYIGNLECGNREYAGISVRNAKKIADALGVSIEDLL